MLRIFSAQTKYSTWRKLWVALAKAEKALGFPITDKQISALEKHIEKIDFERVAEIEEKTHHDVMAHLHAFGEDCPEAKGILHLGATSAYLTDNTDLIQMQMGMKILLKKLSELLSLLASLAEEYAAFPTIAYTHFQPAQPTSVGKRICLWLQDFLVDAQDMHSRLEDLHFLGIKGATGTQASFMILFDHDISKIQKLEQLVAREMGFSKIFPITGQTYPRKQDVRILDTLQGVAGSAHKCATDLRLLSHMREMSEGRGEKQVGSSAMPHKQNPIYAERVCGLARFLISLCQNPSYTLATQWLERSLDDSAGRRMYISEAFLTADAIIALMLQIFRHIRIDSKKIENHLQEYLPMLALENILMFAVKKGKDRQEVHEKLRKDPSQAKKIAEEFGLSSAEIEKCFRIEMGTAAYQVKEFLKKLPKISD